MRATVVPASDVVELLLAQCRFRKERHMGVGGRVHMYVGLVAVQKPDPRLALDSRAGFGDEPGPEVVMLGRLHRNVRAHFCF